MKWLLNFLKGKWLGHPLHPILVHVPMAMWPGALIFKDFRDASIVATAPLILSILGKAILIVSVYLGGRMTYHYGISVARMSKDEWREIAEAGGANLPPE